MSRVASGAQLKKSASSMARARQRGVIKASMLYSRKLRSEDCLDMGEAILKTFSNIICMVIAL